MSHTHNCPRAGMTLVELMVSMVILTILASLSLAGMTTARTRARAARTATTIRKISEVLLPYYEQYETRRPSIPSGVESHVLGLPSGREAYIALKKLALRRLMALELPERVLDLNIDASGSYNSAWSRYGDPSIYLTEMPPVARRYRSIIVGTNTPADLARAGNYDSAELLYLIITRGPAADPDIVSHFRDDEVGDSDGDGLPEFVDGWRRGINFKRWPIGFLSPMQPIDGTLRNTDPVVSTDGHRLVPLVYSSGFDGEFDVNEMPTMTYGTPRTGPYPRQLDFNPFAYDRSSNVSLVSDEAHSSPFLANVVVLTPVRRAGSNTPVTFIGSRVSRSGAYVAPQAPDVGCTIIGNAAFMTVGSQTGGGAADNIHNHDMTR